MASIVKSLYDKGLIDPPKFAPEGMAYEVIMGSEAYGIAGDASDRDIYGFTVPPIEYVFPTVAGEIPGFSRENHKWQIYQKHHIVDENMEYDISVYSLVRFFYLTMGGNPNMLDSLFVPDRCVIHMNRIGRMVRENRHLFLSKAMRNTYSGMANEQIKLLLGKHPKEKSKRADLVERFGFDTKYASHAVRCVLQVEQALLEGDMDLERNRKVLTNIREGLWKKEEVVDFVKRHDIKIKELSVSHFIIPEKPNEAGLRDLLASCLEEHFGSIDQYFCRVDRTSEMGRRINEVLREFGIVL